MASTYLRRSSPEDTLQAYVASGRARLRHHADSESLGVTEWRRLSGRTLPFPSLLSVTIQLPNLVSPLRNDHSPSNLLAAYWLGNATGAMILGTRIIDSDRKPCGSGTHQPRSNTYSNGFSLAKLTISFSSVIITLLSSLNILSRHFNFYK